MTETHQAKTSLAKESPATVNLAKVNLNGRKNLTGKNLTGKNLATKIHLAANLTPRVNLAAKDQKTGLTAKNIKAAQTIRAANGQSVKTDQSIKAVTAIKGVLTHPDIQRAKTRRSVRVKEALVHPNAVIAQRENRAAIMTRAVNIKAPDQAPSLVQARTRSNANRDQTLVRLKHGLNIYG